MIASLPLFHRITGQPVMVLGEGDAADAKRRLVERAGGIVVGIDNPNALLAFVAVPNPEAMAAQLKASGMLVNVVDRPELCDFTTPSILDRNPVLIAIGTGGASAGLAKALRMRLEMLLPQSLGKLALALSQARNAMRLNWPNADKRRRALDAALNQGGILDPLIEDSAFRVANWLGSKDDGISTGNYEIRIRSADPDDLTLRDARFLGLADVVVHDAFITPEILSRARADARRIVIGKGDPVPEEEGLVVILRR